MRAKPRQESAHTRARAAAAHRIFAAHPARGPGNTQFHNTNPCSTAIGVSIDAEKFVWLIDPEGWGWKIDPMNVPAMQKIDIAGSHYVYPDMTGGQLQSILPQ